MHEMRYWALKPTPSQSSLLELHSISEGGGFHLKCCPRTQGFRFKLDGGKDTGLRFISYPSSIRCYHYANDNTYGSQQTAVTEQRPRKQT